MKDSDKLLHLAAQIDQIHRELEIIWKAIGGMASHDCGIVLSHLQSSSKRLRHRAALLQAEDK